MADQPQNSGRIPGLDGLRAISVALVIAFHARLLGPGAPIDGNTGVTIFFALSGFLITSLLRSEYAATGRIELLRFAKRRALRIFPAYYAALVLVALAAPRTDAMSYGTALLYLTNFAGPLAGTPWLIHFWSLSVEEHFYLLWPLAVLVMRGRILLVALNVVALSIALLLVGTPVRWTLPAAMPIAMGAIVASIRFAPSGWLWLAASLCLLWLFPPVGAALLVGWVANNRVRFLEAQPLVYIGTISYGLYIWQGIWTANGSNPVAGFPPTGPLLAIALTLVCAMASWHLLERPLLLLRPKATTLTRLPKTSAVVVDGVGVTQDAAG